MIRRCFWWVVALSGVLTLLYLLVGCATRIDYQPVPAWLIPQQPNVETIKSKDLLCLSDETYIRLVARDRACWQYARELRALLGPEAAP